MLFLPKPYFTSTFFATIFLLKYLAAVPNATQSDRDLAINHITLSHRLFESFTKARDHQRGAKLIEVLGRLSRSGGFSAELHVKSRLGASLVADASWNATQMRMRLMKPDDSLNSWLNYEALGGIPLAPEQTVVGSPQKASISPDSQQMEPAPPEDGWNWGFWDDSVFDSLGMVVEPGSGSFQGFSSL